MARFIECSSSDEKEYYIVNLVMLSPEMTIVLIGGEKVKAQIIGDKAKELREAMGLKVW